MGFPRRPYDTRQWRAARAQWGHRIEEGEAVPCVRCGQPIRPGQAFDLDYAQALANGGGIGRVAPSHRACNRSHGQMLSGLNLARGIDAGMYHTAPPSREWFDGATAAWAQRCTEDGYDPERVRAYYATPESPRFRRNSSTSALAGRGRGLLSRLGDTGPCSAEKCS
jgi:hypothetical protein